MFLTTENDEIRGLRLRFRGAGALWSTVFVKKQMRSKAKKHFPGAVRFETVGRIPDGGSRKNEHVKKSLRNSCGAVLARNRCGVEKKRHPPGEVRFGPVGRIPDGGGGK